MEGRGSRKQISGREARGYSQGNIREIPDADQFRDPTPGKRGKGDAQGHRGRDGRMLSGPERNPGQTGVAQTSRQIPLRTGDKTGNIQASDEFEYTERDLDKR